MSRRPAALLCITVLLLHAAPASARRAHPTPAPTDEVITAVSNPCDLTPVFNDLNATITRLETTALDTGRFATMIRHTTRSRPYLRVEHAWDESLSIANHALDTLSTLPIALDASPNGAKKKAAAGLIAADQKAIEHLVDYGHYAVNFERSENLQSQNFNGGVLGFGVSTMLTAAAANNTIHRRFDSNNLLAHEAIIDLRLPEHRYVTTCRVTAPPLGSSTTATTITDPCELNDSLLSVRETLAQMENEASEAGAAVLHLRATSRRRPYKRIEAAAADIKLEAQTLQATLADLRVTLDPTPDTPKKQAAQDLLELESVAVTRIFAYTEAAVGLERTQNNLSMTENREYLSFGVAKGAAKTLGDNVARQEFNHVLGEPENINYSLRLPEYHYAKLCGGSF